MDTAEYDYSVFIGDYGVTITEDGFMPNGRSKFTVKLHVSGEVVYRDIMTAWNTSPLSVIGSAIAFMTDHTICEEAGILDKWYDDRRREELEFIGWDMEVSEANSDRDKYNLPHIKVDC